MTKRPVKNVGCTVAETRRRAVALEAGRAKIRQLVAERRSARVAPDPPPRYDDVFFAGLEQLEELDREAGDAPRASSGDQAGPGIERAWIDEPGEPGYRILQPIPVEIRRVEIGDFEASFREANIAMSGSDSNDALQALAAEILETFDVLLSEQNPGPDAAEQRRLLCTHIART